MKNIKKYIVIILVFLTIIIGFSSWIIVGEKNTHVGTNSVSGAVAYINDKTTLYTSIEGALYKAESGDIVHVMLDADAANKKITRDCTIKEGVTLNIPYEDGVVQTENSDGVVEATATTGSASITLKNSVAVSDGIKIINKGTIVIGGVLSSGSPGNDVGHTAGNYARLVMGSNTIIENYGIIQCCGKIDESTLGNGSKVTVYENGKLSMPFVLKDFRGGSTSYGIYKAFDSKQVSPFNQFELRNVEPLIEILYGGFMNGYANIRVSGVTGQILSSSLVKMVGDTDDYFVSLVAKDSSGTAISDNSKNKFTLKYNKSSGVAEYIFYGGASINKIEINMTMLGIDVNLSTEKVYLPFSWRLNVIFKQYEGQTSIAHFYANNQMIKLLPGTSFIIEEGCSLSSNNFNVYSFFRDKQNAYSASNIGGRTYENKEPAVFKVYGTYINIGTFGGTLIKGENASVSLSNKGLTTYEALIQDGSSLSTSIKSWLTINEEYLEVSEDEYANKQRVTFGVASVDTYGTPSYSISGGLSLSSTSINKNYFVNSNTSFTPNLLTNISKANYNGSYYVKDSVVSSNQNINTFEIYATTGNFGDPTASSVTISGASEVGVGSSTTLSAVAYNSSGNQAYTTKFTWSSSDTSIATVNSSTGKVTGVKIGTVTITATTIDGAKVFGTWDMSITDPTVLLDITISATKISGSANTAYDTTITVTLNPTTASIDSVSWDTNISGGGASLTLKSTINDYKKIYTVGANSDYSDKTGTIDVTVTDVHGNSITKSVTVTAVGESVCVAAGTMFAMADGTYKAVENIEPGDMLLTFDHLTGQISAQPVLYNDHSNLDWKYHDIINLEFDDGTVIKVINEHTFFDLQENKYVFINNASYLDYIGHTFYGGSIINGEYVRKDKVLVNAYITNEYTGVYSPVTAKTLNQFAEGLLSTGGGDIKPILNIYKYDESLKYDEEDMKVNIEKYGLYAYEDFDEYYPIEVYEWLRLEHMKVVVGRGDLTFEEMIEIIDRNVIKNTT